MRSQCPSADGNAQLLVVAWLVRPTEHPRLLSHSANPEACPGHGVSAMTPAQSLPSEDEWDEFLEDRSRELGQLRK